MNARWRVPALVCAGSVFFWLLLDAQEVRQAVLEGMALCMNRVIPALFPCLVITSLLLSFGFGQLLMRPFGALMALYGLDGSAAAALVFGLAGGYPLGARTAAQLTAQRLITREEGNRLLTFCNNANPAFLINVLGVGVFGSVRVGVWLWLIHVLSALLAGLILGRQPAKKRAGHPPAAPIASVHLSDAFVSSVRSGLNSTAAICAFVLIFYVLASPLRQLPGFSGTALTGLVELFSAVPRLTPDRTGFFLAAGLSGWGGVSVLCQAASVLGDSGLSPAALLGGKAVQGMLSLLLSALAAPVLFP